MLETVNNSKAHNSISNSKSLEFDDMGLLCDAEYNLTCKYGNHTEIEQICQLESKMGKNVELSFYS